MSRTSLVAAAIAMVPFLTPHAAHAADLIAYVSPSRGAGQIVVSAPDASDRRTLFKPPADTHPDDGIGILDWSPDGQRLAFSSSHQWSQSLQFRDIYVISRDGRTLTRPTATPEPGRYDDHAKGKVSVIVDSPSVASAEMIVTVEGASAPIAFLGKKATRQALVFEDVADLGEGVRQYVRVYRRPADTFGGCWLDIGVFADVVPGKTVDAGQLSWSNKSNCMRAWQPNWIDNETIAFLYVDHRWKPYPPNDVWSVRTDIAPGDAGTRLLNMANRVGSTKISMLSVGPSTSEGQELLALATHGTGTTVYVAPAADAERIASGTFGRCARTICKVIGVDWRSDGNGLFVAESQSAATGPGPRNAAVLYEFDAATRSRREILSLPNEVIGRVAVSPDNRTIAFERAGALIDTVDNVRFGMRAQCPCAIWLVDVDGGNLRLFAKDGRAPAWTR